MIINTSAIPHIFRNRFLKDSGNGISVMGGGGTTSNVGNTFEPHNLWGQYFDDTHDIDGDLMGVGNIDASGNITASGVNATSISANSVSGGTITSPQASLSALTSNAISASGVSSRTVNATSSITTPQASISSITSNAVSASGVTSNTVNATNSITSPSASLSAVTSNTVNVNSRLTTDQLQAVSGYVNTLLSDKITVDNLTVTKAAHFFQLIIDQISATKGQVIITPANAKIVKVDTVGSNYRCYFRASDDEREISNTFQVNDQVVCQTFNAATQQHGVSYNVSNTYYWRLCVGVGTTTTTVNGKSLECHYIDLSSSDKDSDSISSPMAGDEVVQLGNRNDTSRQSAIIISAYNSEFLDKGLTAPSIVQYNGINNYNLSTHRMNVISKGLNQFKGEFITSNR